MAYDKKYYDKQVRRAKSINRLGLALDYDGPKSDRDVPTALGDFILQKWMNDDSQSSNDKVERLLEALRVVPEVAEREINALYETGNDLTMLEKRTLYLLSIGFVPKEIARFHDVSLSAIKERTRNIRTKLGVHETIHAVANAIRLEIIP